MNYSFKLKQCALTATPRGHHEKLIHFVTQVPPYTKSSEIHETNE